jgi:carboxylesterase type B
MTYRLSGLGFFSSSEIQKDAEQDSEHVYGSWAIEDTALALQWVTKLPAPAK